MQKSRLTANFSFEFENKFDSKYHVQWFLDHPRLPFYACTVYLIVIFCLKTYMKTKAPFNLRKFLVLWNSVIAIFSIFGALRSVTFLFYDMIAVGFHNYTCNISNAINGSLFWAWLFSLSKFPELGDTLFIVLRKRKLIFLHWYHHVTVLLASWFSFSELAAPGNWMSTVNYTVHSVMYTYYALRAFGMKIPRWFAMAITTLQILQMFILFSICIYISITRARGWSCEISEYLVKYLLFMFSSYIVLFVNFFYNSYLVAFKKKSL